jgi:toxin ParE1/3/4
MMRKFNLSNAADKDLKQIWQYTLETWSREQANKYVSGLLAACADIAQSPESLGQPYDYVRVGYRKYPWCKHVIFYLIQDDGTVLIVRILHQRMDYERHL